MPKILVNWSNVFPISLIQKIRMATMPLIMAPFANEMPVNIFNAKPQPAILPILKANPPNTTSNERICPKPGNSSLAISCARMPLKVMARQIFICAPKSKIIEMTMTNPKLVINCSV